MPSSANFGAGDVTVGGAEARVARARALGRDVGDRPIADDPGVDVVVDVGRGDDAVWHAVARVSLVRALRGDVADAPDARGAHERQRE